MRDGAGPGRFRLLAIDIDGTLLNSRSELTERTVRALRRAAEAGMRPVLCTGRRYRRTLPLIEPLEIRAPLVCNSGALVKDPQGHRTLWKGLLDPDLLRSVLNHLGQSEEWAIAYQDRFAERIDFLTPVWPSGKTLFDEYLEQNVPYFEVRPRLMSDIGADHGIFELCALGTRARMLQVERDLHAALTGRIRTHVLKSPRYRGYMCEILRPDVSKWSAVLRLARRWGIGPRQIVAVGDDVNDVPMLEAAGLGVAMANAPEAVRRAAGRVTLSNDENGLALLIEHLLAGRE